MTERLRVHGVSVSAPVFGQSDLSPIAPVVFTVSGGKIVTVTVTDANGMAVAGVLSADASTWTLTGRSSYRAGYQVTATVIGPDGEQTVIHGGFATLTPASQAVVTLSPQAGSTVGVAAPISLTSPQGLTPADRAALQKRLTVVTSAPVEGSWAWLQRDGGWVADWRPKEYWPQDISVQVSAKLFGVQLAKGVDGAGDLQSDFRIGRNQTVQIDGAANRLIVERSGTVVAGYPASLTGGQVGNAIPSGIYTVQETLAKRVFNPPGSGNPLVAQWVVRLSNGGEFVEALTGTGQGGPAAPVGVGVNLSGADAKAYFETVLRGDPVQVVNTGSTASVEDTGSDWSIPWEQWTKLSG